MIPEYYVGKTLLITGCTGFLGKYYSTFYTKYDSFLQMWNFGVSSIRYDVSHLQARQFQNNQSIHAHSLRKSISQQDLRVSKAANFTEGVDIRERMQKQIFESRCFDRCRRDIVNFEDIVKDRIVPVAGDIIQPYFGLSKSDLDMVSEDCTVIINSAASVDFNERMDDAIRINTLGPKNLIDVAHHCKKINIVIHISTAYVNCNKPGGFIEEKIYEDLDIDEDEYIQQVLQMDPKQIEEKQKELLMGFPNSYTLTKNLGERILRKH